MFLSVLEAVQSDGGGAAKNARNAAAGALRNLNPGVTAERKLNAYFYNVGYSEGIQFDDHQEMVQFLRDNRFKVASVHRYFDTIEEVRQSWSDCGRARSASIS